MENVFITATDNSTILVRADSKRFGKSAIMFEGRTFMECCDYVRRATGINHFKLESMCYTPLFTDTEGRTMPCFQEVVFPTERKENA